MKYLKAFESFSKDSLLSKLKSKTSAEELKKKKISLVGTTGGEVEDKPSDKDSEKEYEDDYEIDEFGQINLKEKK